MLAITAVELTDQAWLLYRKISEIERVPGYSAYKVKRLHGLADGTYLRYQRRIKKEHRINSCTGEQ